MTIKNINPRESQNFKKGTQKRYTQLQQLIAQLQNKEIEAPIIEVINLEIDKLNAAELTGKAYEKQVVKSYTFLVKYLEKELKLVPKSYYQLVWMAMGMAVFGVPMGVALSSSMGNYAFIGIGIPIGMVVGMAIGAQKDKQAEKEGRQLDVLWF